MNKRLAAVVVTLAVVALACVDASKDRSHEKPAALAADAFAGCDGPDAGQWGCPGEPRAHCRYEVLRRHHARCEYDSDCELVRPDHNCMGIGACGPSAVARDYSWAFAQAANAELAQACSGATCTDQGSCAAVGYGAVCERGVCALFLVQPDGGPLVSDPTCDAGNNPRDGGSAMGPADAG